MDRQQPRAALALRSRQLFGPDQRHDLADCILLVQDAQVLNCGADTRA